VYPVDSRQVGLATGFAVLSAADAVAAGLDAARVASVAAERAATSTSLFYVDTLEYLRRGGRIGAAAALLGGALAVKPLLGLQDGRVNMRERVRTSGKALARLEELAVEAAGSSRVDVGVAHLASADRAEAFATKLAERLADNLEGRKPWCAEIGAAVGAHVGPGMVAVCVAPRIDF
jgi:DegV family protein with EDD domain